MRLKKIKMPTCMQGCHTLKMVIQEFKERYHEKIEH